MSVEQDVIAIIKKKVRIDRSEIGMDDKLLDLGLESLDALELVFDIEEKFNIEIPVNANDANIGGFETVGDVVREVEKLIARKAYFPVHRVVVTGLAAVTPLGHDAASYWAGLKKGEDGIRPVESIP